ncbi:hypothetical protein ACYCNC_14860, partial [Klebsiella pneumoniae]
GSAILGCVGCLVGHLFMFLVGGKTPDQSVHLNLTTTYFTSITQNEVVKLDLHQAIVDAILNSDAPGALLACQALLNAPHHVNQ